MNYDKKMNTTNFYKFGIKRLIAGFLIGLFTILFIKNGLISLILLLTSSFFFLDGIGFLLDIYFQTYSRVLRFGKIVIAIIGTITIFMIYLYMKYTYENENINKIIIIILFIYSFTRIYGIYNIYKDYHNNTLIFPKSLNLDGIKLFVKEKTSDKVMQMDKSKRREYLENYHDQLAADPKYRSEIVLEMEKKFKDKK